MASQVLEEFLESIESFPQEIQSSLYALTEKDNEFEEIRKGLSKKRTTIMKAKVKGIDENTQDIINKKIEKEYQKGLETIEQKIAIGDQTFQMVEKYIRRLDAELMKLNAEGDFKKAEIGYFEPPRRILETPTHHSPKKQKAAAASTPIPQLDLPIDPNEPVYCICRQVSFGDMIGCDNPSCEKEWFHYGCVGLTTLPKGKWFCTECIALQKQKNK